MLYFSFALNVLLLAAFVYQSHQASKERQSLALLIKSRDVAEFVRAEQQLAAPAEDVRPAEENSTVDLDKADPEEIAQHLG
jgi:outer membrane biosynthesis protein TonB